MERMLQQDFFSSQKFDVYFVESILKIAAGLKHVLKLVFVTHARTHTHLHTLLNNHTHKHTQSTEEREREREREERIIKANFYCRLEKCIL